ncbi:MAG TPA: thioesterase family protein [Micromonosporaceae bacterium]
MTTTAVTVGHVERIPIHFDDLDAMGVVHNARFAVLLERALSGYWAPRGHSYQNGAPTSSDVFHAVREFSISYLSPIRGTGEVDVHFWADRFAGSSAVYRFRFLSTDHRTVHAEGHRSIVKLDPRTLRPTPWSPEALEIAAGLLAPTTSEKVA